MYVDLSIMLSSSSATYANTCHSDFLHHSMNSSVLRCFAPVHHRSTRRVAHSVVHDLNLARPRAQYQCQSRPRCFSRFSTNSSQDAANDNPANDVPQDTTSESTETSHVENFRLGQQQALQLLQKLVQKSNASPDTEGDNPENPENTETSHVEKFRLQLSENDNLENPANDVPQGATLENTETSHMENFRLVRLDQEPQSFKNVAQNFTDIKPIPSLPSPISGYPTPWIGKEDYIQYLLPLFSRGWGVSFKTPRGKEQEGSILDRDGSNPMARRRQTAHLVARYKFDDYQLAVAFLNKIAEVAVSENHHPRILTVEKAKTPSVALVTQTDSAIRPTWNHPQTRRIRGITRRDLRLAVLVETLYTDLYGDAVDMRSIRPSDHQPSWDLFIRRLQATSLNPAASVNFNVKCYACGGPHILSNCPVRHEMQPRRPCGLCQGNHWMTDCPKRQRGMYECRLCGMNHPTEVCPQNKPLTNCPNCGGDHWLADCRVGQISEQTAQEMALPIPEKQLTAWSIPDDNQETVLPIPGDEQETVLPTSEDK